MALGGIQNLCMHCIELPFPRISDCQTHITNLQEHVLNINSYLTEAQSLIFSNVNNISEESVTLDYKKIFEIKRQIRPIILKSRDSAEQLQVQ